MKREIYGKMPDGREALLFTMANSKGMTVSVTNYGGIVTSVKTPDRAGNIADIVLGFDEFAPYLKNPAFFGALVGRYANRIEGADFELNGKVYKLYKNEGNNHLHGGKQGFDKKLWDADIIMEGGKEKLELRYLSPDGEEGYPGNLDIKARYSLDEEGSLAIEYHAVSDADTVINLTNHSYFNLAGHGAGSILDHRMQIHAHRFTAIDEACIPTGEIRDVAGTPMDFTQMARIGGGLQREAEDDQLAKGHGYDHNYVIDKKGKGLETAAEVYEPISGRRVSVFTDKPGIQFYAGNFLDGTITGKGGAVYGKRSGLCLETQHFPNSVKLKHFPSPVLKAGESYNYTTVYRFSSDR
jgi:aldose 1-epimerase